MLTEPILLLETSEGTGPGTLADALAGLCDGSLTGFDGLAAHQRHPWELFLYQTTALALLHSGEAGAVEDEAAWRALANPEDWRGRLLALTPGCEDTAWSLVVDDLTRPAFLQPPIPSRRLEGYSIAGETPDKIDVLVTSKNHDVKAARAGAAEPRHWVFALVTLQTQQGYSGRHPPRSFYWGIARMNGGLASRPLVMLTPGRDLATCFRRGVRAALQARSDALDKAECLFSPSGTGLVWLEPWDREEGIWPQTLDPLFVEICRRVRLRRDEAGRIVAWGRPSEVARVAAPKEAKGNLGDAWTPLNKPEGSALTVGAGGFDYRLVARLLDPTEFDAPVAMRPPLDDPSGDCWLRMAVLVRGQGKTEGLHERWERVPAAARKRLGTDQLGRLSKGVIDEVQAAKQALNLGLLNFVQAGPDKLDFKDDRPRPFLDAFEQEVDRVFVRHLFARAAAPEADDPYTGWKKELVGITRSLFGEATARLTAPDCRRERATAIAELVFARALRKAGLTEPKPDDEDQANE